MSAKHTSLITFLDKTNLPFTGASAVPHSGHANARLVSMIYSWFITRLVPHLSNPCFDNSAVRGAPSNVLLHRVSTAGAYSLVCFCYVAPLWLPGYANPIGNRRQRDIREYMAQGPAITRCSSAMSLSAVEPAVAQEALGCCSPLRMVSPKLQEKVFEQPSFVHRDPIHHPVVSY